METKEVNFTGFKMNGFLALFLFLFVWAGLTAWWSSAGSAVDYPELRIHDAGAE